MSKDVVPPTPDTFPTFINQKLNALGLMPKKADLDAIRALLYISQEERVLSDEELQDWKKSEKEVLEDQNIYKNRTENLIKTGKSAIYFCLLFTLPISLCFYILRKILDVETSEVAFKWCWIINLIAMAIYIFYLKRFNIRLFFVIPKTAKVLENESSHWQNSMTTTELQSRQKALVSGWEELLKEQNDNPLLIIMSTLSFFATMAYFGLRFVAIHELIKEKSTLSSLRGPKIFLFVDYVFTFLSVAVFAIQSFPVILQILSSHPMYKNMI
ncbi:unnamed protein product [Caenorhabditis brenneri]